MEEFDLSSMNLCACMGPQNGEPYCPCGMRGRGLETKPLWTEEKREELKQVLKKLFDEEAEREKKL